MSTSMDDSFYPNDMDNYSLQQSNDFSDTSSYGAVDPRLLGSNQNHPILSNEQRLSPFDYTIFRGHAPQSPVYFDPDLSPQSYEPMRHQMLGHRRSVSVPPEDLMPESLQPPPAMVFHRGGTPLGDSMGNNKAAPNANKKWLKKAAATQKRQMQRHSPYPKSMQLAQAMFPQQQQTPSVGPTSAPQQMILTTEDQIPQAVMQGFDIGSLSSPQFVEFNAGDSGDRKFLVSTELTDVDALTFDARGDAGTAVLGMLGFAERLSQDCAAMREFLKRGFKAGEEDEGERLRQGKRAINHQASALEDGLEMIPLPDSKAEEEITVPVTGQDIRDLDDEKTSALLELYNIPYIADMFLHDKKLAYLRFVGASRALMHLVLD